MAQDGPRCAQDNPSWAQLGPKMPQHRPKTGPRWAQDGPKHGCRWLLAALLATTWLPGPARRPSRPQANLQTTMLACFLDFPAPANHRKTIVFSHVFLKSSASGLLATCKLQDGASKPRVCLKMPPQALQEGPNGAQHGPRCPNTGPRQAQDEPKMGPSTDAAGSWQPCWPRHASKDPQGNRQDHNQASKQPCLHAFLTFLPRQIIKKH